MSDPQATRLTNRPPRAEPLQPDHPGRGGQIESDDGSAGSDTDAHADAVRQQKEQSDTALENVRDGYK